jgi:uncharacterized protein
MTPDERSIVTDFLKDLEKFRGTAKDPEAAELIDRAVRQNPDAAYVLVQHAILANRAMQSATARIKELESQVQGGGSQSSFLGGSPLMNRPSGPWGPWGSAPQQSGGYASSTPPQQQAAPPPISGGRMGSFFGNIASTAAGVAGGALLFEGLSGLLGGHSGWGWGGGGWGGAPVINEYINEASPQQADFGSTDVQMDDTSDAQQDADFGSQDADFGGDFGSSDDSV